MKQLTSTHAHSMNWEVSLPPNKSTYSTPEKTTQWWYSILLLFLPKVKCLITSKQMASTHPNLSKISCRMENIPIYVSACHTQSVKNVCQILNLLYRPTMHLLWYHLRAVSWFKYLITISLINTHTLYYKCSFILSSASVVTNCHTVTHQVSFCPHKNGFTVLLQTPQCAMSMSVRPHSILRILIFYMLLSYIYI